MRSTLLLLVLSISFFACGEGGGLPSVPSVSLPEAGLPSAPTTPAVPDAGKK